MRGSLVAVVFFVFIWYGFFRQWTSLSTDVVSANTMFICDGGKIVSASFYDKKSSIYLNSEGVPVPQGKAEIMLSDGRYMSLHQTLSGSGARYANIDESFIFLTNGNKASVLENNLEKIYTRCIRVADQILFSDLPQTYVNNKLGFSLRLPDANVDIKDGYVINDLYNHKGIKKGKEIVGVSFGVSAYTTQGTNLSPKTYMSIERLPDIKDCKAHYFFGENVVDLSLIENDTNYSVASFAKSDMSSRYEETIYALANTHPCVAVRYFIRYSIINDGKSVSVKEFDKEALLDEFDKIRHSLIVGQ